MKGSVEVYKYYSSPSAELLYKESNLLVDGAGSLVVDMLTTSPSVSSVASAASLMDTSNFTVQAISFGKAASGYTQNAHTLLGRTGKNLLSYSEQFDATGVGGWLYTGSSLIDTISTGSAALSADTCLTVSANQIPGPYGGAVSADLLIDHCPASLKLVLGGKEWTSDDENTSVGQRTTNFVSGSPYTFSVFVKATSATFNGQRFLISLKHKNVSGADNPDSWADNWGVNLTEGEFEWEGEVPKLIRLSVGTPVGDTQNQAHLQNIGNGWWRIGVTKNWSYNELTTIEAMIFPGSYLEPIDFTGSYTYAGSLYVWGAQLELGYEMTSYEKTVVAIPSNKDSLLASSTAGNTNTEFLIRAAGFGGVSSYAPEGALPSAPTPEDKKLELATRTESDIVRGLDNSMGHNLNVVPYRESFAMPLSVISDVSSYHKSGASIVSGAASIASGLGFYMGCYPEGSGVGGSSGAIVTSFDASFITDPTANLVASATYNSLFNHVSSMDISGFVGAVYEASPDETEGRVGLPMIYGGRADTSGLAVSSDTNFSSNGNTEVKYIITFASGDLGYSNLYGGIYNMGLWGIDNKKTMVAGNNPPYSFNALNNPRKYKLFAKKSFTDNLAKTDDVQTAGAAGGPIGGLINQQDLTIIWRIEF